MVGVWVMAAVVFGGLAGLLMRMYQHQYVVGPADLSGPLLVGGAVAVLVLLAGIGVQMSRRE